MKAMAGNFPWGLVTFSNSDSVRDLLSLYRQLKTCPLKKQLVGKML